jgi:hypothetical protein
MAFSPLGVNEV